MAKVWMIYGANGFTGRMLTYEALARGMKPILGGRNAGELIKLSQETGLPCRLFDLKQDKISKSLGDVDFLVNCAGPFVQTARPLLDACRLSKTHYLDISGEFQTFEEVFRREKEWQRAGIIALPGLGFDVVPSDCLAAMLKRQVPDATRLRLAILAQNVKPSHGTLKTALEGLVKGGRIRHNGQLKKVRNGWKTALVNFSSSTPQLCVSVPLADLSSAWHSTRIPNIETYLHATSLDVRYLKMSQYLRPLLQLPLCRSAFQKLLMKKFPPGNPKIMRSGHTTIWGEATNAKGQAFSLRLQTPEPYRLTVDATLKALNELMQRSPALAPGAYTPSSALDPEFIFKLDSVELGDIIPSRS